MTTALAPIQEQMDDLSAIERVIVAGDLAKLSPDDRWDYYQKVCKSVGLNPFTKPFEYIVLSGKMVLYANKGAGDQLRRLYGISIGHPTTQLQDGLVIVTVTGTDARGRSDSEIGAVPLPAGGEARANALMKALTKAKRRLTLSMCGLGMLDESEIETIPNATRPDIETVPNDAPADKPKPTFLENVFRYDDDDAREDAEAAYERLAALAVERGHKRADAIRQKRAVHLGDGELEGSVKALARWEKSLEPSPSVDVSNGADE